MAVRNIYKTALSLVTRNGGGLICGRNTNTRLLTSFTHCGTDTNISSILSRRTNNCIGIKLLSNSHNINRRTLYTKQKPKSSSDVNMGSILEHHKYKEMKSVLSKRSKKGFSLGPLDTASLFILSKGLSVNLELLSLDALALSSHHSPTNKGYAEIREMKQRGSVKMGKLNKEDEAAILEQFNTLLAKTALDKEVLIKSLFATKNRGRGDNTDKDFMLKRQLVGFWLLQGTKDSDRRLPMQVYTKLAALLFSGSFTEEEDAAILTWVDKHGPTCWAELARSLGRRYLSAGPIVQNRYEELTGKAKGNRRGAFNSEELTVLIKEVLKRDQAAFEKPIEGNNPDFKTIASHMKRPRPVLNTVYGRLVHPTVRRLKLGALETDVRGSLIQQVKENNWKLSADIEFDKLARLPQFGGHNSISLQDMYHGMIMNVGKKLGKASRREVTVEQVEKWWIGSTRRSKRVDLLEKEQLILEAYYAAKQELGIGSRKL